MSRAAAKTRHGNLAIFVPHAGCPCHCSFCDQRVISGQQHQPTPAQVEEWCAEGASQANNREMEIAFFGGSFTAIEPKYMVSLLKAASAFVRPGGYCGIRVSTRPDAIDENVLCILKEHKVTAIELGAQSMDDVVLAQNRRGHSAAQVELAATLIQAAGFSLGLQMMTGLYVANRESDLITARRIAALFPDTVRIYPAITLRDTYLAELYGEGLYQPQTLEQAVALGAQLLNFFTQRGIRVIRMGLHAQQSLEERLVAGPYHPAFRELCEGALLADRLNWFFAGKPQGAYEVFLARGAVSKITGHGGKAVAHLRDLGYNITVKQSETLSGLDFLIEEV